MKQILDKLKALIKELEEKHGSFLIFALFLRKDAFEKWDVVISANWLNSRDIESYKMISSTMEKFLTEAELLEFSRIVLLEANDPVVEFLLELETIKNGGYKEFSGDDLTDKFKFVIQKAYLLRSQPSL